MGACSLDIDFGPLGCRSGPGGFEYCSTIENPREKHMINESGSGAN